MLLQNQLHPLASGPSFKMLFGISQQEAGRTQSSKNSRGTIHPTSKQTSHHTLTPVITSRMISRRSRSVSGKFEGEKKGHTAHAARPGYLQTSPNDADGHTFLQPERHKVMASMACFGLLCRKMEDPRSRSSVLVNRHCLSGPETSASQNV